MTEKELFQKAKDCAFNMYDIVDGQEIPWAKNKYEGDIGVKFWMAGFQEGISHQLNQHKMGSIQQPAPTRELSFGEKAVGITFNPGKHPEVEVIKVLCAKVIDQLDIARSVTDSADKKRMYSEAITAVQTGQMWGVKAATWQY